MVASHLTRYTRRFVVTVPDTVTHELRLRETAEPVGRFGAEVGAVGAKIGPVLV